MYSFLLPLYIFHWAHIYFYFQMYFMHLALSEEMSSYLKTNMRKNIVMPVDI
jgi:hypothetical protein